MTIKHAFVSVKAASPDPDVVDGPTWNEPHILDGGSVDQVLTRDPAFDPPAGEGWKWAYPKLRETGGPTTLTPGVIPDGTFLRREGSGIVGASDVVRVLDRQTATVQVVNTAGEADLYRFTVPAGTLGAERRLRLTMLGDLLNSTGSPQVVRVRVRYGTHLIVNLLGDVDSAVMSPPSSPIRVPYRWDVEVAGKGAPNAQVAAVSLLVGRAGFGVDYYNQIVDGALAEDTTQPRDLAVTVEFDVASPSLSARSLVATLELLP